LSLPAARRASAVVTPLLPFVSGAARIAARNLSTRP
jgi:hypothetical protein